MSQVTTSLIVLGSILSAGPAATAPVQEDETGRLTYVLSPDGNRIPDFSSCGYRGADEPLPLVEPKIVVEPGSEDDTERIQAAIDFVSRLPLKQGRRGAVILARGEFQVRGQIRIHQSGVVLRGQGAGQGGTIVRATGRDRRSLIRIGANPALPKDEQRASLPPKRRLTKPLPVGATTLRLESIEGLQVGSRVMIEHVSTKEWIARLGIDRLGWREGTRNLRWERTITAINGLAVTIDAPLVLSIAPDSETTLSPIVAPRCTSEVGVEDVCLVSDYDSQLLHDEQHAWYGIQLLGVRDGWVNRVQFRHFVGGAVTVDHRSSRLTVQDCASFAPVSEIGGYRRHTYFTLGQQCLFLRCWSEYGIHDFATGHCAPGPNAFVNCYAQHALGDSGPIESCSVGVLFDNVRINGHDLCLTNRWNSPPKSGWSAINCLLWQCQASTVRCDAPPIGGNWAIGIWANVAGDGHISHTSDFVTPLSFYQQQLRDRVGERASSRVGPFLLKPIGATNPSAEQARAFTLQSTAPAPQLVDVIRERWKSIRSSADSAPRLERVDGGPATSPDNRGQAAPHLELQNGWLTVNEELLTGHHYRPRWWRGDLVPSRAKEFGPAITRFAPGREGTGLTDDLEQVAQHLTSTNIISYDHHYGLWYDRRRDDHLMVRRADGQVAPPFYEQPFARSGEGRASDGLTRFDLTKWNHWYWQRLKQFAQLGDKHGFVLFHHHYFQHNILEAGAHWADSPWRSSNNINQTDFPEPPPYVGDKRIFLAEQFYDLSNGPRRALHRNYIRKCLDNFSEQQNVVHFTSGEFTGPLSFVQFWLDTTIQWKRETGRDVKVALSCTKDVQDAILEDPNRAEHVDVIDIRYWTYTESGELYAPLGNQSLSPRQHLRRIKPKATSFASIVRSVKTYGRRFPNKAVLYNANVHCRANRDGWAIVMGGGSLPNLPLLPSTLQQAIVHMKPNEELDLPEGQWSLSNGQEEYLIYSALRTSSSIQFASHVRWEWCNVDPNTGRSEAFEKSDNGLVPLNPGPAIVWARKAKVEQ